MAFDYKMETNIISKDRKMEWIIKGFSKLPDCVESPEFYLIDGYSIKCKFKLDFNTLNGYYNMCITLGVTNESECSDQVLSMKVGGTFSFKSSNGTIWNMGQATTFKNAMINSNAINLWQKSNFPYKLPEGIANIFGLQNDVLIFESCLEVCRIFSTVITPVILFLNNQENCDKTLKLIYEKNAFCDFTFHIDEKFIRAHKSVLSARSPVFEKMFEHDTLETKTNSLNVKDSDFVVFDCFIRYLYTWEIKDVEIDLDLLLQLYEISDKYEVADLQLICAEMLLSNFLTVETACKILYIADMHNDNILKEKVVNFFKNNFSKVSETSEWSKLIDENVRLASEVVVFATSVVNGKI